MEKLKNQVLMNLLIVFVINIKQLLKRYGKRNQIIKSKSWNKKINYYNDRKLNCNKKKSILLFLKIRFKLQKVKYRHLKMK